MAASSEINNDRYSSINPSLPLDIVSDILLLLPVKTLSRLKLVSKSWLSLISSPSFRSSHRRRRSKHPLLLVATCKTDGRGHLRTHLHVLDYYKKQGGGRGGKALLDRETTTGYYSPREESWFPRLVFSFCLDLVCMYDPDDIYIRNPATREQIILPRRKYSGLGSRVEGGRAAAFAYLPSTGEYKVLRVFLISFRSSHQHFRSEVFTLGSGRWREKEGPPFWVHDDNSAVVDEAVHFLPCIFRWRLGVGDNLRDEAIARFDLKKEEWSTLPLPGIRHFSRDSRDRAWFFRLTRLGGSLCMECLGRSGVDLWLLEEGRDSSCASWVKAYSIDYQRTWSRGTKENPMKPKLLTLSIYIHLEFKERTDILKMDHTLYEKFFIELIMKDYHENLKFLTFNRISLNLKDERQSLQPISRDFILREMGAREEGRERGRRDFKIEIEERWYI
ncbi:F-box protein At3g07870-like [Asparagus officinalis]|uniref:F-box protein At3g07870-like n=1 Tax=Asparagus officinalis TaxID=4686 RepID=UPI00098DF305|nr:F-box protein At3g07870-like [Asparagus officinalis]